MRRVREESRLHRADKIIRVIGGLVLLAISAVVFLAGTSFLVKILARIL
jgi:hypothetical protein